MPKKLTEEQIEKIRELQEQHLSDAEISRIMSIPYATVYRQRPEVKEKVKERMRADPFLLEFQDLVKKVENGTEVIPKDNPYLAY